MGSTWQNIGDIANIAQLTGLDAVKLIGLIVNAATTARMHKKNCTQFALHLKLIGNLLEQLKISEMKKYPETREPLEQLEDALRRSYLLINSCHDRSYFYLLAMGWNIVYQFKKAQNEIDRYLKIIPLITLVDNARVRERLEYIERDQREYTLDDDDKRVQDVIMKPDPCVYDTMILQKSLSHSYPNMPIDKAIQKESEKLQLEMQRSRANYDIPQCQMIQHLLDVTVVVGSNCVPEKGSVKTKSKDSESKPAKEHAYDENHNQNQKREPTQIASRSISSVSSGRGLISTKHSYQYGDEWSSDLLGCCSEPLLCIKTFFCPCSTFSRIASVATNRPVSAAEACNDLVAYSLILSCCCYTCCIRRKLRKMLNITGGFVDDFLSHFMCCCCALVQEWREVEIRGVYGSERTETSAPKLQYMES